MIRNVGGIDRTVRLIAGAVLVALPVVVEFPGYWDALPFVAGAVLLATALLRHCPINRLLGINTRR